MRNQTKAYAYGLTTVLLWSTVASAFKLSLRHVDHFQLLLVACAVSILVLSVILVVQGRWRLVLSYSGRQYAQSLALGLLNPFLYYLVLFKAYDLLPAQEAQPLNYTWALALAFLSVPLLGPAPRCYGRCWPGWSATAAWWSFRSAATCPACVSRIPLGVALALGSTIIWALYWIYKTKDQRDPVAGLWLNFRVRISLRPRRLLAIFRPARRQPAGPAGRRLRGDVRDGGYLRLLADGACGWRPAPRKSAPSSSSRRFCPWCSSTCWLVRSFD